MFFQTCVLAKMTRLRSEKTTRGRGQVNPTDTNLLHSQLCSEIRMLQQAHPQLKASTSDSLALAFGRTVRVVCFSSFLALLGARFAELAASSLAACVAVISF